MRRYMHGFVPHTTLYHTHHTLQYHSHIGGEHGANTLFDFLGFFILFAAVGFGFVGLICGKRNRKEGEGGVISPFHSH